MWIVIWQDSIALEGAVAKAVASGRHPDRQFGATYRVSFGATKCLVIVDIHSSWHTQTERFTLQILYDLRLNAFTQYC